MRFAAVLLALAWACPGYAASLTIHAQSVRIDIENAVDCADGSMLVCITTLARQRAYLHEHESNAAFVTEAYRIFLRRSIDAAGLSYYVNRLAGNTITRDGVIDELIGSAEYRALHP